MGIASWTPTVFSITNTNLDTKRRVHLERHGSDVTRVNTLRTRHNRHHAALGTQFTISRVAHDFSSIRGVKKWIFLPGRGQ